MELEEAASFWRRIMDAKVTGVTLSEHQVELAKANAKKHGVDSLVSFEVMDFCHTTFYDASFDVIWGIESICHAEDKMKFVQEASRVFKKGRSLNYGGWFFK